MEPRQHIINEILQERVKQTDRYSNTHDDTNTRNKRWKELLMAYLDDIGSNSYDLTRNRLIQVAALCICAIESIDRTRQKQHE